MKSNQCPSVCSVITDTAGVIHAGAISRLTMNASALFITHLNRKLTLAVIITFSKVLFDFG